MALNTEHTNRLDQECDVRGLVIETIVKRENSGAVGVWICVGVEEVWEQGQWLDWSQYRLNTNGTVYLIKKDGTVNEKAVETLAKVLGWDGDLNSFRNSKYDGAKLRATVRENISQSDGKSYFNVAWFNPYDSVPMASNSPTPIDDGDLRGLQQRYFGQFRSLCSASKSAGPAPAPTKPMRPAAPTRRPTPEAQYAASENEDVPF